MKISVIIPTLHSPTIGKTIQMVRDQISKTDEVIVVGLYDSELPKLFPNIRFISTDKPVNAATARNIGMKEAKGNIFLFIDSDCIPSPNWLETHREYQKTGNQVVGGGVDINNPNYWTLSDNLSMFHEFSSNQTKSFKFLLPTLNLSIHRTVWEKLGDLDESLDRGEDSDWTVRMRKAGYLLLFCPSATILHAPVERYASQVIKRSYKSGQHNIKVRFRHSEDFKTPRWIKNSRVLSLLSPLIGTWATLKIYVNPLFWRYWLNFPAVYLTKVIYCWGAAQSVRNLHR